MMILKENHNIATFKRAKKYKLSRDSMDKESMDYANWNDIGLYAICFIYNAHVWLDYHRNGFTKISNIKFGIFEFKSRSSGYSDHCFFYYNRYEH